MRLHTSAYLVVLALLGGAAAPVVGQSLAEIARREEERRKAAAKDPKLAKPKVYTNDDVGNVPAPLAPASVAEDGAKPAAAAVKPADGTAPAEASPATAADAAAAPAAPGSVKDQAYWSGRATEMRARLDRDRTYVDALQSRINALTTDFVNTDDPARRGQIEADRRRALDELDRLKKSIEDQQKAIAGFEEEARREGVSAGWLR
jgi:hypothetical protein